MSETILRLLFARFAIVVLFAAALLIGGGLA